MSNNVAEPVRFLVSHNVEKHVRFLVDQARYWKRCERRWLQVSKQLPDRIRRLESELLIAVDDEDRDRINDQLKKANCEFEDRESAYRDHEFPDTVLRYAQLTGFGSTDILEAACAGFDASRLPEGVDVDMCKLLDRLRDLPPVVIGESRDPFTESEHSPGGLDSPSSAKAKPVEAKFDKTVLELRTRDTAVHSPECNDAESRPKSATSDPGRERPVSDLNPDEDEKQTASKGSKRTILVVLHELKAFEYTERPNSSDIALKTIGESGEIKEQTVRTHTPWLVKHGYLVSEKEGGHSGYWLTPKGKKLARTLAKQ